MKQTSTIKRTTVAPSATQSRFETPLAKKACSKEDFNRKVQEKAYQLYVARGYKGGHEVEDWLQAEKIVKSM